MKHRLNDLANVLHRPVEIATQSGQSSREVSAVLHEHSPTYDLACNDFLEKYIDLIHVHQAKFEIFEASIIAAKEEAIFLAALEGRDRRREYRTVRATVSLLDKAASRGNTQRIVICVVNALDDFASALNEACTDFWAAKNNKPDAPFRHRAMGWMTAYQTLYERLLRSVYAPVVTAYRVSNPSKQTDSFKLDNEGRARLKAIKEIEANSAYKMDLYRLGLNHSIRNAIAHRHFEIYTAEEYVEYWDSTNPRQRVSEDDLRQLCSDALVNASFIVDASVLWFVNHRSVAEKRGWLKPRRSKKVGFAEYEAAVCAMFSQYSLTVTQVSRDGEVDRFCIATQPQGIDQTSTIYRGGDGWTESFDTTIKYEETSVLPQLLGILQHITGGYKTGKIFLVELSDDDGQPIGSLRVKAGVIRSLKGPKHEDLNDIRKAFDEETIGDAKMWIQTKTMPERATPRLRVAKDEAVEDPETSSVQPAK